MRLISLSFFQVLLGLKFDRKISKIVIPFNRVLALFPFGDDFFIIKKPILFGASREAVFEFLRFEAMVLCS
uniref:Uncharacterized protein n=1 Tax=Salix viminalis TaxID=40686 RepID=A0A6N2KDB6_SALVM